MSKREIGYWWVKRPEGPEIVYWTGSEAQCFGTDATLREREITEWISYEGKSPEPKAVDRKDDEQETAVTVVGDCFISLPPGYDVVEDHEDHGTYQARLLPWGGQWTNVPLEAADEAWEHHVTRFKPSLDEAEAKAEKRWGWMVEDAKRARDRLEREHGTWARLSSEEQMRVAENIRDTAFAAWRGQLLADGRWFGLESAAQTLAESMDKRRGQIVKMPPVTVTLIPYDPRHEESATTMPARSTNEEQWRPGKSKAKEIGRAHV